MSNKYNGTKLVDHFIKVHWNTILLNGNIQDSLLEKWIDDSYDLIVGKLPGSSKKQLELPT